MKKSLLSVALLAVLSLGLTSCMEISPIYLEGGTSWIVDGSTSESGEDKEDEAGENSPEHTEHTYDEGVVTKEATCMEEGEITYTCTVCGDTYIGKIDPLGHDYVSTETEPTCGEDGYITKVCSRCGDIQAEASGKSATGEHTYGDYIYDETNPSLGHYRECSVCGYKEESTHTFEDVVTAPTCVEKGYTTKVCECGYSYIDEDSYVEELGHSCVSVSMDEFVSSTFITFYEKEMCARCGEVISDEGDSLFYPDGAETDVHSSDEDYVEGESRVFQTHYGYLAALDNYGDIEANVSVDVETVLFFSIDHIKSSSYSWKCTCEGNSCCVLDEDGCFIKGSTCTCDGGCAFCEKLLSYEDTIEDHITLELAYNDDDWADPYDDGFEEGITKIDRGGTITIPAPTDEEDVESRYLWGSFIWISDIDGCVDKDADEFDTFIGNTVSSISFRTTYSIASVS